MTTRLPSAGARRRALAAGAALISGVAVLATAPSAMVSTTARHAHQVDYVALGDSYASALLVPDQVGAHCLRSGNNYPSPVARSSAATRLTDVTCSGATTADMTGPQGTAAPQLDAVDRRTDLVTLTIGGNDIGFTMVLGTCARLSATDPAGAPCRDHLTGSGTDQVTESIAATAPKVAAVIRQIRHRAPHAKVVVVGYPDLFPEDGAGPPHLRRTRHDRGHRRGGRGDVRAGGGGRGRGPFPVRTGAHPARARHPGPARPGAQGRARDADAGGRDLRTARPAQCRGGDTQRKLSAAAGSPWPR